MCYDIRRAEACVDESAHHTRWSVGQLEGKFFANCPKLRGMTRRRTGQEEGGYSCGTHETHTLPGCVLAHPRTHAPKYLQDWCASWPSCRAGGGVGGASVCAVNPRARWTGSLSGDPCVQLILLIQ